MSIDNQDNIASLANLRHALRNPINIIIGYTEMLLEDLEMADERTNLNELQQIRELAIELIFLIKTLLNEQNLEFYQSDLEKLLTEQTIQNQIQMPTNSIIGYCQQILKTTSNQDLVADIKKINQASQDLLAMAYDMVRIAAK